MGKEKVISVLLRCLPSSRGLRVMVMGGVRGAERGWSGETKVRVRVLPTGRLLCFRREREAGGLLAGLVTEPVFK